MGTLHQEMIEDMGSINADLGAPSFTWNGGTYNCIANVAQFNRDLGDGGFRTQQLLTITVPRYDIEGNTIFPGDVIPQSQQKITFNGIQFRIENIKQDAVYDYGTDGVQSTNGARLRIVAIDVTKGI